MSLIYPCVHYRKRKEIMKTIRRSLKAGAILFYGKREDNGKMIHGSKVYIRDSDGVWLADYSDGGCKIVRVVPETVGLFCSDEIIAAVGNIHNSPESVI